MKDDFIIHIVDMESPLIKELREYLKNTSQEQKDKDWVEIKKLSLQGPSILDFVENMKSNLLTK